MAQWPLTNIGGLVAMAMARATIRRRRTRLDLDGAGWAEWDHFDEVIVGDRLVPRVIDVELPGGSESPQPALRFRIEMVDGVPLCSRITLERRQGGRGVQSSDLRDIRLQDWIEDLVAVASSKVVSTDGGVIHAVIDRSPDSERDAHRAVRAMQRGGRRRVDQKHLTKVAEIYREHQASGRPVEAVETAFGTSYRSAARWIQRARQEGLL